MCVIFYLSLCMHNPTPTHIIIKIKDVEDELIRLKDRLSYTTDIMCCRELIQGKIEAYVAIMMQEKIVVPQKKVL